LEVQSVRIVTF